MKILLVFLSFFSFLLSETILINDDFNSINTINQQITIEDVNGNLSSQDIFEGKELTSYPKYFTEYTNSAFWTKVVIKNNTNEHKEVVFRNQRAGTDKIDVYVYQSNTLKKIYLLGDLREQKNRPLSSIKSAFSLILNPNEEIIIISKFKSFGSINLTWEILTSKKYNYTNNMEMIFYAAFGGIMIALIIYNAMMFLNLRDKTFLFYSLHGISFLWFQYAYNGMLYFLDIGLNLYFLTISTWLSSFLIILFLLLFTISFFKLKEKSISLYNFFLFLSVCISLIFLVALYLLIDSSLTIYTLYSIIFIFVILLSVLILGFYAVYKKFEGAIYFLIGEGIYILSSCYFLFKIAARMDISNTLQYMFIPVAILFEMMFLSIALSARVGKIKKDNNLINKMLNEEEKFSFVGKSIANLTHQWKKPISQLSSQLMYLETLHFLKKDEMLLSEFTTNIEQMNTVIKYMKDSVDEIYDFYGNSEGNSTSSFYLNKQIDMVLKLQSNSIILLKIDVIINCPEDILVLGSKHSFSNILMILFDNSINQFTLHKIKYPIITISIKVLNNNIEVVFSDNGGGFDPAIIDKIFITPYTSKGKNGSGLGLVLAKKLIEERLNGTIDVSNTTHGATFRMILHI